MKNFLGRRGAILAGVVATAGLAASVATASGFPPLKTLKGTITADGSSTVGPYTNQSRLNAVQIRNPKTGNCVAPSQANVFNGSYRPLARPLFIYAKGSSFKRTEVQGFLRYIFDNEQAIARRARFIPLTTQQLGKARVNFDLAIKAAQRA